MARKAVGLQEADDTQTEDTKVLTTQECLALEPKRLIRIPFRDGVKQKFVMVYINGHPIQIARGMEVEVPKTVYEILVQAGEI